MIAFLRPCVGLMVVSLLAAPAFGWAHQGHVLLTRLACLRIIDDPAAPAGLREFMRTNMPADQASCEKLAVQDYVGMHPDDFAAGIDRQATMPDQVKGTPAGKEPIAPFGVSEGAMHYLNSEVFTPGNHMYKMDLSNKPDFLTMVPFDPTDLRYMRAGFVPLRAQQCYDELVAALITRDKDGGAAANEAAAKWAGYLAHYIEDSHQPQHSTSDGKSVTYLAGKVPGVPAAASQPSNQVLAMYRLPKGMDPHGDVEFQLFQNTNEPRAAWRRKFWADLTADLGAGGVKPVEAPPASPGVGKIFRLDLAILSDSYDYLPLIGQAAQSAYATGTFDADKFFGFEGEAKGQRMTVEQMISLQNAKAVLQVERLYREAWKEGGGKSESNPKLKSE